MKTDAQQEETIEPFNQPTNQSVSNGSDQVKVFAVDNRLSAAPTVEQEIKQQVESDKILKKSNRRNKNQQMEVSYIIKPAKKHRHLKPLLGFMFFCLIILVFLVFYFIQEDKWGQQSARDRVKIKLLESETENSYDFSDEELETVPEVDQDSSGLDLDFELEQLDDY